MPREPEAIRALVVRASRRSRSTATAVSRKRRARRRDEAADLRRRADDRDVAHATATTAATAAGILRLETTGLRLRSACATSCPGAATNATRRCGDRRQTIVAIGTA